ncbi:hypothetical protein KM92DES2_20130 [uncultured Desulfovibrio sp.]|uniref:Uncharacterized protein n=1 Tax=uncultured Desulfovibrio sp. TaxID=167968 RepID=A0A212KIZ3_9BACT|nr:hypothetical protein KM92DES2_20130 [uncultured Desulfovibrio sp.]
MAVLIDSAWLALCGGNGQLQGAFR